jgi:hypothetical protein
MKIQSSLSELWWVANADELQPTPPIPLQQVLQKIAQTFNFFSIPTAIPTGTEGYKFEHGSFLIGTDFVVVGQLVIYGSGVHIAVGGPTTDADKVFLKLREMFLSMGVREPITPPVKFYRSTLVCDFDKSFEAIFAKYADLISAIQGKGTVPNALIHGTGIAFSADPTTIPAALATYNPTMFSINRKTDVPFSTNRFTCFANMETSDHIAALEQIERIL